MLKLLYFLESKYIMIDGCLFIIAMEILFVGLPYQQQVSFAQKAHWARNKEVRYFFIKIQWQTPSIYPTFKILEERTALITFFRNYMSAEWERHSADYVGKQSKYANGSIPLSRYMIYYKDFHAPALMAGAILWRSTSWSCPNLPSPTIIITGVNQKSNKTNKINWNQQKKKKNLKSRW